MDGELILDLLPQRPPMVMVDGILSCMDLRIVTLLKVREDNVFLVRGRLSAAGMMEMIAQSAAARTGLLLRKDAPGQNKPVPVGVIGQIRNFLVYGLPAAGAELQTEVTVSHEIGQASVISGKVLQGAKTWAEGEMKIFLNPEW